MSSGIFIVTVPNFDFLESLKEGAEIHVQNDFLTTIVDTNMRHQPYRTEAYDFVDGFMNWGNFLAQLVSAQSRGDLALELVGLMRSDGTRIADFASDFESWKEARPTEHAPFKKFMDQLGIYVKFVISKSVQG